MRRTMAFNVYFATMVLCLTALFLSVKAGKLIPLNEPCLGCICESVGECSPNTKCAGGVCGMFGITWSYWADAGKPVVKGSNSNDTDAYLKCATDPTCAKLTVAGYMTQHAMDCNNDGLINCYDYAAIHMLGRFGCTREMPSDFKIRYMACQFAYRDQLK